MIATNISWGRLKAWLEDAGIQDNNLIGTIDIKINQAHKIKITISKTGESIFNILPITDEDYE